MEFLRRYWFLLGVIAFALAFSTNIQAMWTVPEELKETQKSVSSLTRSLELYIARQEVREEKQDYIIELLAEKELSDDRGR